MEPSDFRYVSENTLDMLALHDCRIERVSSKGGILKLEMDFINVLPEHPLNEFHVAKCTNEALLLFENVFVDESFLYNFSGAKGPVISDEDLKRIDYPIDELAE